MPQELFNWQKHLLLKTQSPISLKYFPEHKAIFPVLAAVKMFMKNLLNLPLCRLNRQLLSGQALQCIIILKKIPAFIVIISKNVIISMFQKVQPHFPQEELKSNLRLLLKNLISSLLFFNSPKEISTVPLNVMMNRKICRI